MEGWPLAKIDRQNLPIAREPYRALAQYRRSEACQDLRPQCHARVRGMMPLGPFKQMHLHML